MSVSGQEKVTRWAIMAQKIPRGLQCKPNHYRDFIDTFAQKQVHCSMQCGQQDLGSHQSHLVPCPHIGLAAFPCPRSALSRALQTIRPLERSPHSVVQLVCRPYYMPAVDCSRASACHRLAQNKHFLDLEHVGQVGSIILVA